MIFNSIPFIILFPVTVLLYYLIPKKFRYIWLLVLSYTFYLVFSETGFAVILALMSLVTYVAGIAVANIDSAGVKKAVLILALVTELGMLFVFKYLDFTLQLAGSGIKFSLALPLGISFYTFQAISYMTDVYRGDTPPEYNPLKIALYLSFFLTIVSGPINRAKDVIPQYTPAAALSLEQVKRGMQKMLWGYFLKLAIAGRLAIIVDNVYADTDSFSGISVAFAALSYMFMLYCDFEGYSQIAIGSGCILGIRMKENFSQPFFSLSMAEIWRRWHISLSSWFKDYVYIPLGGNRRGTVRKYFNIFVTLFASGIWHGANLTFFVWGALNGAYIILGQILLPYRDRLFGTIKEKCCATERSQRTFDRVRCALKRIGVYILISFTFIFFSHDRLSSAWFAVKAILTRFTFSGLGSDIAAYGLGRFNLLLCFIMIVFVFVADGIAYRRSCDTPSLITRIPTILRWTIYYALIIAILFSANLSGKEFIYSKM